MRRDGDAVKVGREVLHYERNLLHQTGGSFELRQRFFVNDPWELMAEAIARAAPVGRPRDIAQSFRRQAEDYFRAATTGRELAVRPVLLYYAFLNLSKAFAIARGNTALAGPAFHGISADPKPKQIHLSVIKFSGMKGTLVFQELLKLLARNPSLVSAPLKLAHLMPQILPGHRLWCYANTKPERFMSVERFEILQSRTAKEVWLNVYLNRSDLDRLLIAEQKIMSHADLPGFEVVTVPSAPEMVCYQMRNPRMYSTAAAETAFQIIEDMKNRVWETVKTASPYRKYYIYFAPPGEQNKRLPQMLSIYLLMFFLGSVTRYSPGDFEDLLDSKYGPFFDTFISESPMQFLYLMASDILGREVSKPAII
jgi:hypothetical protein